jgi:hypothetical protein
MRTGDRAISTVDPFPPTGRGVMIDRQLALNSRKQQRAAYRDRAVATTTITRRNKVSVNKPTPVITVSSPYDRRGMLVRGQRIALDQALGTAIPVVVSLHIVSAGNTHLGASLRIFE